ncbi:MAG: hypothetical protein Q7W05_14635 [Deltaproteobacteria bacterium]|nr:hypothetical protein [Deltaproteobacteria bacterium]
MYTHNTKTWYQYDQAGNRTRMTICEGDSSPCYLVQRDTLYDNANRLTKSKVDSDSITFTYWDTGVPKRIGYPNLVAEEYWLTPDMPPLIVPG